GGSGLRHRLVIAHQRRAAGMAQEDDLGDAGNLADVIDRRLYVEGDVFPAHSRLVVDEAGVPAERKKAALRELAAGDVVEVFPGAVRDEKGNMRRRPGIRLVERGAPPAQGDEFGMALRRCGAHHREHCCSRQNHWPEYVLEPHPLLPKALRDGSRKTGSGTIPLSASSLRRRSGRYLTPPREGKR